jgi:hypothetical protein
VFVWGGQRLLAVLQHAQKRQHLLPQPLVLIYYSAKVFSEVPQLRLGCVYPLVSHLNNANDLGKVILCGWRFLR